MELTPRLRLMNWLVSQGLTGLPENDLIRGFCERCCAEGLHVSRGMVFIDTLHPIFEGRGFRWNDAETNESDVFEYGSTDEGEAAEAWRSSIFYHMLENGHEELPVDLADGAPNFKFMGDLAEKGHKHAVAYVHQFGQAGTMGQMDCVYSYWTTRRDEGFGAQGWRRCATWCRCWGLRSRPRRRPISPRRWAGSISGATPPSRRCAEDCARRHRADQRRAVVLRPARLDRDQRKNRAGRDHPFLNDYAQASIDAIHDAGGEVLKLIGDGVLAMFTNENLATAKRAALPPSIASAAT